jgi:hypothetical protein
MLWKQWSTKAIWSGSHEKDEGILILQTFPSGFPSVRPHQPLDPRVIDGLPALAAWVTEGQAAHGQFFTKAAQGDFGLPPLPHEPQRLFGMHYVQPSGIVYDPSVIVTSPMTIKHVARDLSRKNTAERYRGKMKRGS